MHKFCETGETQIGKSVLQMMCAVVQTNAIRYNLKYYF